MSNYLTTNEISEIWQVASNLNELVNNKDEPYECISLGPIELFDTNGDSVGFLTAQPGEPKNLVFAAVPYLET